MNNIGFFVNFNKKTTKMDEVNKQQIFEKIFKEHLKIETYSISIDSLFSPRLKNKIDYKPYYQRNYVWDYNKATYFIESILLGTEIPPLIFFSNNSEIEVIDGRQRFETILRFMENTFTLRPKGLNVLTLLKNNNYDDLAKSDREIIDKFLDAKLRIIEFKLVNSPPLDKYLEDRIKKEIFSRYNSGITPLKKAEIDNAIYDDDALSSEFKNYLEENVTYKRKIFSTFFKEKEDLLENPPIEVLMTFIRKHLVLPMIPITYYARGTGRTDLLTKLYDKISDDSVDVEKEVVQKFLHKIEYINRIKLYSQKNGLEYNRLALECFLWALGILELEEAKIDLSEELISKIAIFISVNIASYSEIDYSFIKEVLDRYSKTAEFLIELNIDTSIYISPNDIKRAEIKALNKHIDTNTKLSELESLRISKPEPSRISIDDIGRVMNRRKFLVRPSYQRKEVINLSKASSIIESILLGITLPALFVFKKSNGISEVIDGQQRLLTLLGYIGNDYIDEKGKSKTSRNHKFGLRKLRILKELNGTKFDDLNDDYKNKILDFQLYVVEIDEAQNKDFDPIDLFIRLNDKPYPIRENSFEMWNSWVDIEVIKCIKDIKDKVYEWFHLKQISKTNDRDRMENEELIMSLVFLEYSQLINDSRKTLDMYQKTDRLNARVTDKGTISSLLMDITENGGKSKENFDIAIRNIKGFLRKFKYVILDRDKTKEQLFEYLKFEVDDLFKAGKIAKYSRRTLQDFYLVWYLLNEINFEMIKHYRIEIKKDLKILFAYFKNIPETHRIDNKGYLKFLEMSNAFKEKYKIDTRKITLTESEKLSLIISQNNESNISGHPIFLGDDIEIDHEFPISKGGKDSIENLKVVHKDENREKGSKVK
jgi:hypothetical protein